MTKKLLELLLLFGIPPALLHDPGTEFTAEVVQHLCKWLNVTIDYGPTGHPRAQGAVERLGRMLLLFGIPLSLLNDPGTEFTVEVVQHLCKWLNVTIDYGPTDHPRAQGAVERLGGWIHETFVELCKSWLRRWDEYVQPALWLHRTTPDP